MVNIYGKRNWLGNEVTSGMLQSTGLVKLLFSLGWDKKITSYIHGVRKNQKTLKGCF